MTRIKLSVPAVVLLSMVAAAAGKHEPRSEEGKATAKAKEAVLAWLKLADGNQLEATWDEAGAMFKASVTRSAWAQQLGGLRGALGKLKSRELKSASFTRSLLKAPEGEYVVTQWDATFENKATVETVTASHEKDGTWKVVGYDIK